tara:strand:- start:249 stop:431 length:183 start_codon:yes stop_codon:yes gene_type:complete
MSSRKVELCVDRFDIEFLEEPNLDWGGWSSILKLLWGEGEDAGFSVITTAAGGAGFFALK